MEFDPYSREIDRDPFPIYAWMRNQSPCHWSETGQCWALTRYDDIVAAANNWQLFSSIKGNMLDDIPGRTGVTLGTSDPPRHDHLKALINSAFMKKSNDHLVAPLRELANRALDQALAKDSFDFIRDFSSPVTVGTLARLLGIPESEHKTIRDRVVLILQTDPNSRQKTDQSKNSFQWLAELALELIKEREKEPQDDLISRLAEAEIDGEKLTPQEVQMTSATFIMAGIESASSFMTMFALNLEDHAAAFTAVADNPALLDDAMMESLRFNTSAQRFRRTITEDTVLHGQKLKAGDPVLLCYGAGNRDERKFEDADTYHIGRKARAHLGFGMGKHRCIATNVAELLVINAMEVFLSRVSGYHRVAEQLEWMPSTTFRSPVEYEIWPTRKV